MNRRILTVVFALLTVLVAEAQTGLKTLKGSKQELLQNAVSAPKPEFNFMVQSEAYQAGVAATTSNNGNSVQSTSATIIVKNIGTSANMFSNAFGPSSYFYADPLTKSLAHTHRGNPTAIGGTSSGRIVYDFSTDGGNTWSLDKLVYQGSAAARYPKGTIVNRPKNTNPTQARYMFMAPTLDASNGAWGGITYGTTPLGTTTNNALNLTSTGRFKHLIPQNFATAYAKATYFVELEQPDQGGSFFYNDSVAFSKFTVNPNNGQTALTRTKFHLPLATATEARIAFDSAGVVGYIAVLGHSTSWFTEENLGIALFKTTDGGNTWALNHVIKPTYDDYLKPTRDSIYSDYVVWESQTVTLDSARSIIANDPQGAYQFGDTLSVSPDTVVVLQEIARVFYTYAFDFNLAVDKNGNAHVLGAIGSGGYVGANGKDLGFAPSYSIYTGRFNFWMVDVYSENGGQNYKAHILAAPYTFRGVFGDFAGDASLSEDLRPHVITSLGGDKVGLAYFDTDTTQAYGHFFGLQPADGNRARNIKPDMWVSIYDVATGTFTKTKNMTGVPFSMGPLGQTGVEGQFVFSDLAPHFLTDSVVIDTIGGQIARVKVDYTFPVTYTIVGTSSASPVSYAYVDGVEVIDTIEQSLCITINQQPASASVCNGGSATFTVNASATSALTYQWRRGTTLVGGNSPTLTISGVNSSNVGTYTCVISAACGSATTVPATLTLSPVTSIISQPSGTSTCEGGTATLSVLANGGGVLTYEWKKGTTVVGTGASLVIDSAKVSDAGSYTVTVMGQCGSVTSVPAVLSVNPKPVILTQPLGKVACLGESVTLSVGAAGVGTLTYQWKKNGLNVGGNSSTLSLPSIGTADSGTYTVVVTNACGSTPSAAAVVSVNGVSITKQPASVSACDGGSALFAVEASGSGLSYQWKRGTTNVGGNSPFLSIPSVSAADAGSYTVSITSACGLVNSSAATLTLSSPTAITTQPANVSVCAGAAAALNVVATGSGLSYQWRKGAMVVGGNAATLNIASATTTDAGSYVVTVMGACGTVTSSPAVVTVSTAAPDTIKAVVCSGDSVFFAGSWRKAAGVYTGIQSGFVGCDSTATLVLSVAAPSAENTEVRVICAGDSSFFEGTFYKTAGTFKKTYVNAAGCDSVVALTLIVNQPTFVSQTQTICQGDSITFGGQVLKSAGIYTTKVTGSNSCDSTVTLTLTVSPKTFSTASSAICQGDSIAFGGSFIKTAGTYTSTLSSAAGCDSVVALTVTVNPKKSSGSVAKLCEGSSLTFGSITITTSGLYTQNLTTAAGCDSTVSLLVETTSIDTTVLVAGYTATALESGATYTWYNCATNAVVSNARIFTATVSGTYKVMIAKNGCTRESGCIGMIGTSFNRFETPELSVYPNPTRDLLTIETGVAFPTQVMIFGIRGDLVKTDVVVNTQTIDLSALPKGLYILRAVTQGNVTTKKIIVE